MHILNLIGVHNHDVSRAKLRLTESIHDYCMARLGHEHMAVDSKELFRPGRGLLLGRLPPSGVVLAPPLTDPSGWETHGGRCVLFPPSKSLTFPLPIISTIRPKE